MYVFCEILKSIIWKSIYKTVMKLDFNNYPLSVYNQSTSKSLLKSIGVEVPNSRLSNFNLAQAILSSFVSKAAGAGLLSLIDNVSIGLKGQKARKCLATLICEQTNRVNSNSSTLLEESRVNLMATSCVTDHLASLESGSWGNGAKNIGKAVIGLLSFRNPLETIWESVAEVSRGYEEICQVYHIAFLLNVYNSKPSTENIVKKLIVESLCNDSNGESSFSTKKRPFLFSDMMYKTLEENLQYRLSALNGEAGRNSDLYTFVKWRKEFNEE